ncbi:hypothetical protein IB275_30435 [Pseudomonas sp. PDM21]|uniref:hypothetical protein n=1 Tax=Pseudomonas sp. PDM21 TaxID=2769257 RepID=UPI00177CDDF4|nr:hypothetical protein [Pseudomonas sp. PDM21]MBD9674934.1 hypothetical protein [Pseudomonas sp. PDM21]
MEIQINGVSLEELKDSQLGVKGALLKAWLVQSIGKRLHRGDPAAAALVLSTIEALWDDFEQEDRDALGGLRDSLRGALGEYASAMDAIRNANDPDAARDAILESLRPSTGDKPQH